MSCREIPALVAELRSKAAGIVFDSESCLFVRLPAEWITIVETLLRLPSSDDEIVIDKFRVSFKHRDLLRLKTQVWLNDEVINFYMKLSEEREKALSAVAGRPKNLFMNTFFYSKLVDHGRGFNYSNVKKWFKGVDIFSCERIFVPINMDQHWSLVCIYLSTREIHYIDSMLCNKNGRNITANIAKWLQNESLSRNVENDGPVFTEKTSPCPQQTNFNDCGIFLLSFIDLLSNDLSLNMMDQSHCDDIRNALAFWIIVGRLVSSLFFSTLSINK